MAGKKRSKGAKRKPKSHGLWIAPDLERTIKGEGGRRGLSEPPYGYYLQLADLALKSWPKETAEEQFAFRSEEGEIEAGQSPSAPQPKSLRTATALKRSQQLRVAAPARPPKVDLPKTQAPKPPKLAAPKPPKRRPTPKLSVPKPPNRRR